MKAALKSRFSAAGLAAPTMVAGLLGNGDTGDFDW